MDEIQNRCQMCQTQVAVFTPVLDLTRFAEKVETSSTTSLKIST